MIRAHPFILSFERGTTTLPPSSVSLSRVGQLVGSATQSWLAIGGPGSPQRGPRPASPGAKGCGLGPEADGGGRAGEAATPGAAAEAKEGGGGGGAVRVSGAWAVAEAKAAARASAVAELNVLASLLGTAPAVEGARGGGGGYRPTLFTLSIFDDDGDDGGGDDTASEAKVAIVRVDGTAGRKESLEKMVGDLGFGNSGAKGDWDGASGGGGGVEPPPSEAKGGDLEDDEDDLLALMDAAGCK